MQNARNEVQLCMRDRPCCGQFEDTLMQSADPDARATVLRLDRRTDSAWWSGDRHLPTGLLACERAQVLGSQIAAGQDSGQSIASQIVNPDRGETRGP